VRFAPLYSIMTCKQNTGTAQSCVAVSLLWRDTYFMHINRSACWRNKEYSSCYTSHFRNNSQKHENTHESIS